MPLELDLYAEENPLIKKRGYRDISRMTDPTLAQRMAMPQRTLVPPEVSIDLENEPRFESRRPDASDRAAFWLEKYFPFQPETEPGLFGRASSRTPAESARRMADVGEFFPLTGLAMASRDLGGAVAEGDIRRTAGAGVNLLLNTTAPVKALGAAIKYAPEVPKLARAIHADESGVFVLAEASRKRGEIPLANQMWDAGKSMEEIHDATGLFPDNLTRHLLPIKKRENLSHPKWQAEIPDAGATFDKRPIFDQTTGYVGPPRTLGEYMTHRDLYDVVPEARDVKLKWTQNVPDKSGNEPNLGTYRARDDWKEAPEMELREDVGPEIALHEGTHFLDSVFGNFAGGNPLQLNPSAEKLYAKKERDLLSHINPEQYAAETYSKPYSALLPEERAHVDATVRGKEDDIAYWMRDTSEKNRILRKLYAKTAENAYGRYAGEVTANNVGRRYILEKQIEKSLKEAREAKDPDFTARVNAWVADTREKLKYPWKTEAVSIENQLFDPSRYMGRRLTTPAPQTLRSRVEKLRKLFGRGGALNPASHPEEASASEPLTKLYHGSPHDFEKPDISKIGTGEGAQLYGQGFYTAQERKVAEAYRDALSQSSPMLVLGGKKFEVSSQTGPNDVGMMVAAKHNLNPTQEYLVRRAVHALAYPNALPRLRDIMEQHFDHYSSADVDKAVDALLSYSPKIEASSGKLYEFGMKEDPKNFLSYDLPIDAQRDLVPKLRKAQIDPLSDLVGREGATFTPRTIESMNRLADAGIPGVRYLDEGSRHLGQGNTQEDTAYRIYDAVGENVDQAVDEIKRRHKQAGGEFLSNALHLLETRQPFDQRTRNYVIFNPEILTLLKKYGLGGLVMGGAGNELMKEQRSE